MSGLLDYYPSEKYVAKGWAPEKVPLQSLAALAKAQTMAQKAGLLSPDLAGKLLANSLVEGRFDDFGFNFHDYPPSPERDAMFKSMGMQFGSPQLPTPPEGLATDDELRAWDMDYLAKKGRQPFRVARVAQGAAGSQESNEPPGYFPLDRSPEAMARMAAIGLAERAKLYGQDKAIERWNGQGPGARNHVKKVDEMLKMLSHPKNARLLSTYKGLLSE